MLLIKKVINNNVLLVQDSKLQEFVIMGKGIGYQVRVGDYANKDAVEKSFKLANDERLIDLVSTTDEKIFYLTNRLVDEIKQTLPIDFSGYNIYSFIDHISGIITRQQQNIVLDATFDEDILSMFDVELKLAQKLAQIISDEMEIELPQNEIIVLAIHISNAQNEMSFANLSNQTVKIIKEITDIVRYYYKKDIDDNDFFYIRFISHLKFFVVRHLQNQVISDSNLDIYEITKEKYPKAHECNELVTTFLNTQYNWEISDDEKLYLLIHIAKITN